MRRLTLLAALLSLGGAAPSVAQGPFHSTQGANLPTAEIYPGGSWLFEISHRFGTPVSNGASDLWGLDGPVANRIGLTYSLSDRAALGVQRSNQDDNVELNVKLGVWTGANEWLPLKIAVMGGVAWNTQVFEVDGAEDNEMQLYAQLVLDVLLAERLAIGIVPSYLRNPRLRDVVQENALALGVHGQLYLTDAVSLFAEWVVSPSREDLERDTALLGVEFETRGHFFKLLLGNQYRLNSTQYLAGTPTRFEPDEWMLGFNIQRLLPF